MLKLQFNRSKAGKCLKKVHFANGFHRYLLTAEECRGGGLLGPISAPVGAGLIHPLPPEPKHQHSFLGLPALLLFASFHGSWSLAPCSWSARARLSTRHGRGSPSASYCPCSAQSHHPLWDQSASVHPSRLALEGAFSSTLSWRGRAGLARTYTFCIFCHWSPAVSWADGFGNHLKSHNVRTLQKFSQDIQKAHPEREERPDMLKSPCPKLGRQWLPTERIFGVF